MNASPNIALPTNRDENWRYANLRPLAKARAEAAPAGESAPAIELPPILPGYDRWVFVDGQFAPTLSAPGPSGPVRLLDTHQAGAEFAAVLDAAIASEGADFALARSNASRGQQVVHVAVGDDTEARLELNFIATAAAAAGTSYPRVQIHCGRRSHLRVVERHLSAGARDSAVNAAVDVALSADASLDHCRLQNCADGASVFDTLTAHVGDRAAYRLRTITLGGLSSRTTAFVKLAGRAARCDFIAASIANGLQTHDVFAQIEHVGRETLTRELFRGIATERGKLDDQMLFYLLSRGLDRGQAQALLQWAFIEDAVSQVELAPLRQEIEALIAAQLNEVSALDGLVVRQ